MAITTTSDLNVELTELTSAPAPVELNGADNSIEAAAFRRAIHELESVRAGLEEPMRSELGNLISSLQSQFNISGTITSNIASALQEARGQATQYTAIAAQNNQAALYEAIDTGNQIRISNQVRALNEGRWADFHMDTIDPDNVLNAKAREIIKAQIDNDPGVQISGAMLKGMPEKPRNDAIAETIDNKKWFESQLRLHTDGPIHDALMNARGARIWRNKGFMEQFRAAVDANDVVAAAGAVDSMFTENVRQVQTRIERITQNNINDPIYAGLLEQFPAKDNYGIDAESLQRYWMENEAEYRVVANLYAKGETLTPEQVRLYTVGSYMNIINVREDNNSLAMRTVEKMAELDALRFNALLDTSVPAAEREKVLVRAMTEDMQNNGKSADPSRIAADAHNLIAELDIRADVRERAAKEGGLKFLREDKSFQENMGRELISDGLRNMGLSDKEITKLQTFGEQNAGFSNVLSSSFISRGGLAMPTEEARTFYKNIANRGGPENQESISIIEYYNLDKTKDGRNLQQAIYLGKIEPAAAYAQVEKLRGEAYDRMEGYAPLVAYQLRNNVEYNSYLQQAGVMSSDGKIDVEKLIETARTNRDALGDLTDKQLTEIASKDWAELNEPQRERRVLAHVATAFKSVDAIQAFARDINKAYSELPAGVAPSPALERNLELYNKMVNIDGGYTAAEQKQALNEFLDQQQYLRANAPLKERVMDSVILLSQQRPDILRSADLMSHGTSGYDYELAPIGPAMGAIDPTVEIGDAHSHSKEELRAMAREGQSNDGDHTFQTKMEDRIQDVLNKMDMKQIVTTFGSLLGDYNVGHKDNVTHHEIENALAKLNISAPEQIGNGDSRLTPEELVAALRQGNFQQPATVVTVSQEIDVASAPLPSGSAPAVGGLGR